jgi:hypothetical protein
MKVLGRMISVEVGAGMLSGLFVGIGIDICHLLFVDDTLLFYGADPNHLRNLRVFSYVLKLCRV